MTTTPDTQPNPVADDGTPPAPDELVEEYRRALEIGVQSADYENRLWTLEDSVATMLRVLEPHIRERERLVYRRLLERLRDQQWERYINQIDTNHQESTWAYGAYCNAMHELAAFDDAAGREEVDV